MLDPRNAMDFLSEMEELHIYGGASGVLDTYNGCTVNEKDCITHGSCTLPPTYDGCIVNKSGCTTYSNCPVTCTTGAI